MSVSIGKKTQSLIRMIENGFNVPPFVHISAEEILEVTSKEENVDKVKTTKLINEKISTLNCNLYAVRSSALIEDTGSKSYAGQFMTKIAQKHDQLIEAFTQIIKQAHNYLKGDLKNFSVIIQEYIPADTSGIIFTRNPLGGREIIVESHKGIGEKIVGGEIKPEKNTYYWHATDNELVETAKKLEKLFNHPQDIEWCKKNNKYYILQSRPITTISQHQYQQCLYLDSSLPKKNNFLYEKTEISEIAERPTPLTYSLLEKIYSKGGPIDEVYKKYGVHYGKKTFLKIIGNELFVDREMEIKQLLPSYSFLKKTDGKPHFSSFKGLIKTARNFFALNKIALSNYKDLKTNIKKQLEKTLPENSNITNSIEHFINNYKLIFEINLLTEKAIKKLTFAVKNQNISIPSLLVYPFEKSDETINFNTTTLKGNCLEISDETDFMNKQTSIIENDTIKKWHDSLSSFQQKYFVPIIIQAQQFNQLREYGRWLTVKNINHLRAHLPEIENKYFATIDELQKKSTDQKILKQRKDEYEKYNKFQLPTRLTNIQFNQKAEMQGVSPGKASGKLVQRNALSSSEKSILYTKILSPDIAKDFNKINGIVSEQGGLLSHLSIIARENKIPVIVQFDLNQHKINIGDNIEIDGDTGEISII